MLGVMVGVRLFHIKVAAKLVMRSGSLGPARREHASLKMRVQAAGCRVRQSCKGKPTGKNPHVSPTDGECDQGRVRWLIFREQHLSGPSYLHTVKEPRPYGVLCEEHIVCRSVQADGTFGHAWRVRSQITMSQLVSSLIWVPSRVVSRPCGYVF